MVDEYIKGVPAKMQVRQINKKLSIFSTHILKNILISNKLCSMLILILKVSLILFLASIKQKIGKKGFQDDKIMQSYITIKSQPIQID